MIGIKDVFSGKVKLECEAGQGERFIGFLLENGVKARIVPKENGAVDAVISCRKAKNIASALDKSGIIVYIINIYGLKRVVSAYGKRYGFFAGMILFFVLLVFSSLFVWKVDVVGAENLSKERIRAELSEMGVRPGAVISELDGSLISDVFLSRHPEISWASLNVSGTNVCLVLRETKTADETPKTNPAILVASDDAAVKEILVYDGKAAVSPGSVVKKGDALITGYISGSGLQPSDDPVLRLTGAKGTVTGEVEKEISATVLLSEEITETELSEVTGYVFTVFGRCFSCGKTGNTSGSEKYLSVFGEIEIPVTVKKYYRVKETKKEVTRTKEQAKEEALGKLYEAIAKEAESRALTYTEISYAYGENSVTASALYRYEKNIAIPYMGTEKK